MATTQTPPKQTYRFVSLNPKSGKRTPRDVPATSEEEAHELAAEIVKKVGDKIVTPPALKPARAAKPDPKPAGRRGKAKPVEPDVAAQAALPEPAPAPVPAKVKPAKAEPVTLSKTAAREAGGAISPDDKGDWYTMVPYRREYHGSGFSGRGECVIAECKHAPAVASLMHCAASKGAHEARGFRAFCLRHAARYGETFKMPLPKPLQADAKALAKADAAKDAPSE